RREHRRNPPGRRIGPPVARGPDARIACRRGRAEGRGGRPPMMRELVRRALPRRLGARRILAGPLRGRRLVTSWHDYPAAITGRTERPLLEWFSSHVKRGETWLDV